MAVYWKWALGFYGAVWCACQMAVVLIKRYDTVLAHRRRMAASIKYQLILTPLSLVVFWRLQPLIIGASLRFPAAVSPVLCSLLSVGAAAALLAAQSVYALYYWQSAVPTAAIWVSSLLFGFWVHWIPLEVGLCVGSAAVRSLVKCASAAMQRKLSRSRVVVGLFYEPTVQTKLALVAALALSALGFFSFTSLTVTRISIALRRLPAEADGFKVVILPDLHIGGVVDEQFVGRAVNSTLAERPDLVVLLGDLFDGDLDTLRPRLKPIERFRAFNIPTLYVTGNHDFYQGNISEWLGYLRSVGVRPLVNEAAVLSGVCFVGLDDVSANSSGYEGHGMNTSRGLRGCSAAQPVVVLAHNPVAIEHIVRTARRPVDLVLSGHVHAGQTYTMAPLVYARFRYFRGLYRLDATTQAFVSAGVFCWGMPMKPIGAAEIAVISLQQEKE